MTAEIISVGTELLLGQIVDTDSAFLSRTLADLGINLYRKGTVGDNFARVVAMIDGEVTLKKFNRKRDKIYLEPANSTMEPIVVTSDRDIKILGMLVGVLRKC